MSTSANDTTIPADASLPPPSTEMRSYKSPTAWLRFLLPAALGIVADLMLKGWAFPDGISSGRYPAGVDPLPVIPNFLALTTTVNDGAVFGLGHGKDMVSLFLIFSLIALAIIVWVFLSSWRSQWLTHIALGMITAGAIGNLYDRAIFHGVRDMLQFVCLHFSPIHVFGSQFPSGPVAPDGTVNWYPYIFNIADVLLCIGVPLLMIRWLFFKDPVQPEPAGDANAEIRK